MNTPTMHWMFFTHTCKQRVLASTSAFAPSSPISSSVLLTLYANIKLYDTHTHTGIKGYSLSIIHVCISQVSLCPHSLLLLLLQHCSNSPDVNSKEIQVYLQPGSRLRLCGGQY